MWTIDSYLPTYQPNKTKQDSSALDYSGSASLRGLLDIILLVVQFLGTEEEEDT